MNINIINIPRRSRWKIIKFSHHDKYGGAYYECECKCGNITTVRLSSIKSGKSLSCGCFHREAVTIHACYKTQEYRIWVSMINRCRNEDNKYYGRNGIMVCKRWKDSFSNFLKDMGKRPSKDHSVERINYSKGYGPGNCKWATSKEQGRNRSSSVFLEFNGKRKTVAEWSETFGIHQGTLRSRLYHGWTAKDALTTPVQVRNYYKRVIR